MAIKDVFKSVDEGKQDIENLSIEELKAELAANKDVLLLDIREIQETIDLGTIPGAIHAPRGMLEFWASPSSPYFRDYFQEDRRTILFCAGGGRSVFATIALKDMGFTDVAHVEAGFGGWQKAGETIQNVSETSRWMRRPKEEG
ncbi:MAG: rhodanese-like domain-containing protein [bacterium]|nr:rhodanese-like domain-containing protein [Gammaproteobacteria bacterium]HIL95123.1 rhodanese-like domain-containing protein [Pseudomonadales bacterium]